MLGSMESLGRAEKTMFRGRDLIPGKRLKGKLTDISVGWRTVWGTDKQYRVYRMKNGEAWKQMEDSLRQVKSCNSV